MSTKKPLIAVFSGPTATITNSPPLVTSNKARRARGLPVLVDDWGAEIPDSLRPQRLAIPTKIYVKQFSAHPLESDTAHLLAPPDGWVDDKGRFHRQKPSASAVPVYEIEIGPEDGLYPLPYMGRRADGRPWDPGGPGLEAAAGEYQQTFYPDASRLFEEIDHLGIDQAGSSGILSSLADYHFYRVGPPGGYVRGLAESSRTDIGEGDISPERPGVDYYPYLPPGLKREPGKETLAHITNTVATALGKGEYRGAIWLEGSPAIEETLYWLGLLIDSDLPIVGTAAQYPHGSVRADGPSNIVSSVDYILSGIWTERGDNGIGPVAVIDELIFNARELQKADARPGGFESTGGSGGIIGTTRDGSPRIEFTPVRAHTSTSSVNLSRIPHEVRGVEQHGDGARLTVVQTKSRDGRLLSDAIPEVGIVKFARFSETDPRGGAEEVPEVLEWAYDNLKRHPLAGFVAEGATPYGSLSHPMEQALRVATFCGMPVVKVSRGNPGGPIQKRSVGLSIAGDNLTATKARLLLMACLLRFGSLPPADDPANPTRGELEAVKAALAQYQEVFDSH